MHRTKRLRTLRITLQSRMQRLEKRLAAVSIATPDRDPAVAYVAIETLNAWALFSRSFYLSCALGAETEKKRCVAMSPISDHIGHAITRFKARAQPNAAGLWHRRDEPAWHDPNVLMTICGSLGCSIQQEIQQAFSLGQNVFNDLPVYRNFFAHRNEQTSRAARNIAPRYTLPTRLSPCDLLLSVRPGTSTPVLRGWIDEINITAGFICKA